MTRRRAPSVAPVLLVLLAATAGTAVSKCTVLGEGHWLCFATAIKGGPTNVGDVGVGALQSDTQRGSDDDPSGYVEFDGTESKYTGKIIVGGLPRGIDASAEVTVHLNFRGPSRATQRWVLAIRRRNGRKTSVFTNADGGAWQWTQRSTVLSLAAKQIIKRRKARLVFASKSSGDSAQLDYLALEFRNPGVSTTALPSPSPIASLPAGSTFQMILLLDDPISTYRSVDAYFLDLFDVSDAVIDEIHSRGMKLICYFSAGSYEEWRPDADDFPAAILGNDLDDWDGERWLDVRDVQSPDSKLAEIMTARIEYARTRGCDGVDPDNVDGYYDDTKNNGLDRTGFPITKADQIIYNKFIAETAHANGLAVGLKNAAELVDQLEPFFDFTVVEQCYQYSECDSYLPFAQSNKGVFIIEYKPWNGVKANCPDSAAKEFTLIGRDLDLTTNGVYNSC